MVQQRSRKFPSSLCTGPLCLCLSRHGVEHLTPTSSPLPTANNVPLCHAASLPTLPRFLPPYAPGGRKQYRLPISGERRLKLQSEIKKKQTLCELGSAGRLGLGVAWGGLVGQASRGSPGHGSQRGQKVQGCAESLPDADLHLNAGCHDHSWHSWDERAVGLLKTALPRTCSIPGLVNTLKWQVLWKPLKGCADT